MHVVSRKVSMPEQSTPGQPLPNRAEAGARERLRRPGGCRTGAFAVLLLALFLTSDAQAQFTEYTPPGEVGTEAGDPRQAIEEEMERARWNLGPVRLAPWFGVRGLEWVDDVFVVQEGAGPQQEEGDLTATVGAGFTAYLPLGSDVFWTAEVSPTYVWWRDLDERNQFAGRYGTALFGFFNRFRIEARAGRDESQGRVSTELLQLALTRRDRASVDARLRLTDRLWLFAGGRVVEVEDRTEGADDPRLPDFRRLDRSEEVVRAGLAWVAPGGLEIALGAEETETDLAAGARDLDNEGSAVIGELLLDGNRLDLQLGAARRSLDPLGSSLFQTVDETTGNLRLELEPGWRFRFEVYARRHLSLSLTEGYSHFLEDRFGAAVSAPFGERLSVRLFAEIGESDYRRLAPGVPERADDLTAWGGEASIEVLGPMVFNAGFRQLEVDSNLPGLDRDVSSVTAALTLRIGDALIWR